jgi:hypothetical protein
VLPRLQLDAGSVTVHVAELPTLTVTDPLATEALSAVRTATANVAADSAPYVTDVIEGVTVVVVEPCPTVSVRLPEVAEPRESATRKTSPEVALRDVGVPLICPVLALSVAHPGSVPELRVHVYAPLPPTAASDAE